MTHPGILLEKQNLRPRLTYWVRTRVFKVPRCWWACSFWRGACLSSPGLGPICSFHSGGQAPSLSLLLSPGLWTWCRLSCLGINSLGDLLPLLQLETSFCFTAKSSVFCPCCPLPLPPTCHYSFTSCSLCVYVYVYVCTYVGRNLLSQFKLETTI